LLSVAVPTTLPFAVTATSPSIPTLTSITATARRR
jgi:hypothetical protein